MRRLSSLFFVSVLGMVFVVGCAAPHLGSAAIESSVFSAKTIVGKKVFVISHVRDDFGAGFSGQFVVDFAERMRRCGLVVETLVVSPLDLDPSFGGKRLQAFEPDAMIQIARNGGAVSFGAIWQGNYDVRVFPERGDTMIWRANVKVWPASGSETPALIFSRTLAERIQAEGMFAGCKR